MNQSLTSTPDIITMNESRTPTPGIGTRNAIEHSFSNFLQELEAEKQNLTSDLDKSTRDNISLNQEIVKLNKLISKLKNELISARQKKWCEICGKGTNMIIQNHAICSEICLKKFW